MWFLGSGPSPHRSRCGQGDGERITTQHHQRDDLLDLQGRRGPSLDRQPVALGLPSSAARSLEIGDVLKVMAPN